MTIRRIKYRINNNFDKYFSEISIFQKQKGNESAENFDKSKNRLPSSHPLKYHSSVTEKILRKYNSECYTQNVTYICDMIKEKHIAPKYVLRTIKKTFRHRNHHVGRLSCFLLNTCIQNYGISMNDVRTKNKYLKELKRHIFKCPHEDVKIQALILLQKWEFRFAQYMIFKKDERYVGPSHVKKPRKPRSPNRIRKSKSAYREYITLKTQMLSGTKKGLHMVKDRTDGACDRSCPF